MSDMDEMARKVAIAGYVTQLVDALSNEDRTDLERFVELGRRFGDVAYTVQYADRDLLDPLAQLMAEVQLWMDSILRSDAQIREDLIALSRAALTPFPSRQSEESSDTSMDVQ